MKKMKWMTTGLFLGFCFFSLGVTFAGSSPTPVPTATALVLTIQTAAGETLQAPVAKFKALSLAVITTLIKEGKMSPSRAPENDPLGYATFYLGNNVPADFVNWAQKSLGQSGTVGSAEFIWPAKNGYPSETFQMKGLKVVSFAPAKGMNGMELVLGADQTEAIPPIDFSKVEKQ